MALGSPAPAASPLTLRPSAARAGWLQAARLRHWAHFLLLPLAGYDPAAPLAASALALTRGVLIAFAVLAFGYLLNGLADRHMDASAAKNPIVGGGAPQSFAAPLALLAALATLAAAFAPWPAALATAVGLASGVLYSVGPRLKRFPVLGSLANLTNFAPLLWVGLPTAAAAADMLPLTLCFGALLLQNQLLHEAADRDDDRRGRLRTTYLLLGPRGSALAAAALGLSLTALAAATPALSPLTWPLAFVYVLAFPAVLARLGASPRPMAAARLAHRLAALLTGALLFAALRTDLL